jgi:hypothetical protein
MKKWITPSITLAAKIIEYALSIQFIGMHSGATRGSLAYARNTVTQHSEQGSDQPFQ